MMGGDIVSFPAAPTSLEGRVTSLEGRMTRVEGAAALAATSAAEAASNTAELLNMARAAKGIAGFIQRHGRTVGGFSVGLLIAAGYDSPVLQFVKHFFGI